MADGLRPGRPGIGVVWSTAYLDEAERCASGVAAQRGAGPLRGPAEGADRAVAGRTFLIENRGRPAAHRSWPRASQQPDVVDGVIQGSSVRLVMAEPKPPAVTSATGASTQARGRAGAAAVRGRLRRPAGRRAEGRLGRWRRLRCTVARSMSTGRRSPQSDQDASATSRRPTTSRFASSAARSSACWAPTEPASRRRSR